MVDLQTLNILRLCGTGLLGIFMSCVFMWFCWWLGGKMQERER